MCRGVKLVAGLLDHVTQRRDARPGIRVIIAS
jgi:hypothetical protein